MNPPNGGFFFFCVDALAFIGSDGAIRGARFEQACHEYRASATPPFMSDRQLALAITATY
ncbi:MULTISPECIES: DUF2388 domain-containing protein [Pseudomonas]|uniref:DUF2388 domain-containing protein n=1 Tax=Pseudomonas TaxID=286 RepID=UPI00129AD2B2|nr:MULTISPECIES: DUF2388 domain-containing protein [unclassified Pseudomonas]MBH3460290.1 DUF2388 domain-containing protein [Pseudomonas putida]MBK0059596.1 DUF2388 domain-containing protein [Pseudomonas sp. S44]